MEKTPTEVSLPSLLLRKKRRRKVASSEDEAEIQPETTKTIEVETVDTVETTQGAAVDSDAKRSINGVSATESAAVSPPKESPSAPPDAEAGHETAARTEGSHETPGPGQPAATGKKRNDSSKVLHAARAWLKAPVRRHDATMMERCAALSGLTKKEIADFVAANMNRKPGEWCFTVVDGRITEKKAEQDAIEATIQAEPADVESQVQPPKPSENDHQSTGPSTVSVNPSGQLTRARRERRRAVLGETSDAAEVANMDVQEMNQKSRINPQLDVSVVPNDDSGQSKASKSNVEEVEAETSTRELSCMEDIPSKKRRFTPLRPGTKTARSTALISMPQAFNPSPSRQCRHTNVSKKGCAMVCEHCGEEVLYDGWKLELCDEFDV